MDKKNYSRPNWMGLYILVAGIFGLFVLEARANFSATSHRVIEVVIVLALFFLVDLWLRLNEQALWMEEREKQRKALSKDRASLPRPQLMVPPNGTATGLSDQAGHPNVFAARVLSILAVIGALLHGKDL